MTNALVVTKSDNVLNTVVRTLLLIFTNARCLPPALLFGIASVLAVVVEWLRLLPAVGRLLLLPAADRLLLLFLLLNMVVLDHLNGWLRVLVVSDGVQSLPLQWGSCTKGKRVSESFHTLYIILRDMYAIWKTTCVPKRKHRRRHVRKHTWKTVQLNIRWCRLFTTGQQGDSK